MRGVAHLLEVARPRGQHGRALAVERTDDLRRREARDREYGPARHQGREGEHEQAEAVGLVDERRAGHHRSDEHRGGAGAGTAEQRGQEAPPVAREQGDPIAAPDPALAAAARRDSTSSSAYVHRTVSSTSAQRVVRAWRAM